MKKIILKVIFWALFILPTFVILSWNNEVFATSKKTSTKTTSNKTTKNKKDTNKSTNNKSKTNTTTSTKKVEEKVVEKNENKKETKTQNTTNKPTDTQPNNTTNKDEWGKVVWDISNLSIVVFSPTNMQYLFNGDWYDFYDYNENYWYKSSIILPLAFLSRWGNNDLTFSFRVEHNWKIYFIKISQKFSSELARKWTLMIYIWDKNLKANELPPEIQNGWALQSWENKGIFIKTSNVSEIVMEDKPDVEADILFPNLLWIRKYWSVIILGFVVFFLSSAYLIYKKQVIKI